MGAVTPGRRAAGSNICNHLSILSLEIPALFALTSLLSACP